MKPQDLANIRVLVMGASKVGKSAVTVRYLTKRFIGEYSSKRDLLYQKEQSTDKQKCGVQVLDTSRYLDNFPSDKIKWGDAFVIVYSIDEEWSFQVAEDFLRKLQHHRLRNRYRPVLLLGNKGDLEHIRQVDELSGQELSFQLQCHFYEVSAAESHIGISIAFDNLIREVRSIKETWTVPRNKLNMMMLSKMINTVFRRNIKQKKDKRPSLYA